VKTSRTSPILGRQNREKAKAINGDKTAEEGAEGTKSLSKKEFGGRAAGEDGQEERIAGMSDERGQGQVETHRYLTGY